jgi:hypothetical protein
MRISLAQSLRVGIVIVIGANVAHAQLVQGPSPTAEQCVPPLRDIIRGTAPSAPIPFALFQCGQPAANAFSKAMRERFANADTLYWQYVGRNAVFLRNEPVFAAAIELLENRNASLYARLVALDVVHATMRPAKFIALERWHEVLDSAERLGCVQLTLSDVPAAQDVSPLPRTPLERGADAMNQIATDSTAPNVLRGFTRCLLANMRARPERSTPR